MTTPMNSPDLTIRSLIVWGGKNPPIDLFNYKPAYFNLQEVERVFGVLSRIQRFNGVYERPWSVLDHSMLCAQIAAAGGASSSEKAACLLHDAVEAYTGDLISPIKHRPEMEWFRILEQEVLGKMFENWKLHLSDYEKLIRGVDQQALEIERIFLGSQDSFFELKYLPKLTNPDRAYAYFITLMMGDGKWKQYE